MLGSTLSTNIRGEGSRAAAQVHADESDVLADEDADLLSATLNATLLTWITELNWPGAAPPAVWWPRPQNARDIEDVAALRARRRQEELKALQQLKRLGYALKNEDAALAEMMGQPVEAVQGISRAEAFAAADGSDHLRDQLADLAGPLMDGWIEAVRQRLEEHRAAGGGWQGAANAALSAWPDMQVDPLGRIMGDALALAELEGRAEIVDKTSIRQFADGSKKKS